MTGPNGAPEIEALDNAESAIVEGRENVEAARERELASADNASQANAINTRFDAMQSQLDDLAGSINEAVTQSTQAAVGPLSEQLRGFDSKLDAIAAGGAAGATSGGDDGIVSIEEIADDAGEAAGAVGNAAAGIVESAADEIDKAPARGHFLFRRMGRGG